MLSSMFLAVYNRLRKIRAQAGAVALEAMLSIILMFVIFYAMWAVAGAIYDQQRLATAAQFASQAGVSVFDRSTFRSGAPSGQLSNAVSRASQLATEVYVGNAQGMARDQISGTSPCPSPTPPVPNIAGCSAQYRPTVVVSCAPAISGPFVPNCTSAGNGANAVVAVTVAGKNSPTFALLQPTGGTGVQQVELSPTSNLCAASMCAAATSISLLTNTVATG